MIRLLAFALLALMLLPASTTAQGPQATVVPPAVFTLQEAMRYAVDHYPGIRATLEQVTAARSGVDAARTAYLPRLETLWQTNRATVNAITGLLLPQSVVPSISGPPLPSTSSATAWGSAAGALFSWDVFDFGARDSSVRAVEALVVRARADESLTRLEVEQAVAAAFLAIAEAERAVLATRADVERRSVLARTAQTLADNQLRPGAEATRADAERAASDTRAILARQSLALARIAFARLLGLPAEAVAIDAAPLLAAAPLQARMDGTAAEHPLSQVRLASLQAAQRQEDVVARSLRPHVYVQSSLFARGSGATFNGTLEGGSAGLGPDRANWAAGLQVVLPDLFGIPGQRARRAAAAATTRTEQARHEETLLVVTAQQRGAATMVEAARAVAANTPLQLAAARQGEMQATARYQAGLANIVEVVDAQGLLAQAEFQDAVARLGVWRALLAQAAAHDDLTTFTDAASAAGAGGR